MLCRQNLDQSVQEEKKWEQRIPDVMDILKEGSRVAEAKAAETLNDVKASMRINYFDSDQSDMYQK